jgi:integrase
LAALATRRLFLRIHQERERWAVADAEWIWQGLRLLGDPARLALPDSTIALTTRLLRRTLATRQMQAGVHIHAIAAQLGHPTTLMTMQYICYDRLTHAIDVRAALDDPGTKTTVMRFCGGRLRPRRICLLRM